MKTLILYHSKYGQTHKIADWIAAILRAEGHRVDVINIENIGDSFSLEPFDNVVIGGPLYAAKHSKLLISFVIKNKVKLAKKLTAFYSVSLSAAGDKSQKADAIRCMDEFLNQANWSPTFKQTFAGSLQYRDYSLFTRWLMKWIVSRAHGDTDTSRNYEYTDWKAVTEFAQWLTACETKAQIVTQPNVFSST